MNVGRAAGFRVTPQGQEAQLLCAVEEIFVGKLSWLGHHGDKILQRPARTQRLLQSLLSRVAPRSDGIFKHYCPFPISIGPPQGFRPNEPRFSGQTKDKLPNAECNGAVSTVTYQLVMKF